MTRNNKYKFIILIFLFLLLIILVTSNNINWLDNNIYNFLIGFKSELLTKIMKIITFFADPITIISFCLIAVILYLLKYYLSIYLILTTIISTFTNLLLKNVIRRDRPTILRLVDASGYSFPSGHAMGSICFYGFIIYMIKKSNINNKIKTTINTFLSILIFLIGLSRIYLGVHYASDIIGGFILGYIILVGIITLINKKEIKK